jgi:hypothetical protein
MDDRRGVLGEGWGAPAERVLLKQFMTQFSFEIPPAVYAYALAFLIVLLIVGYAQVRFHRLMTEAWIVRCLVAAERDLNSLLSGALSHDGRKAKIAERREWNEMSERSVLQINAPGYRSIAHDLVEANEKEMVGKSTTMGKAAMTAYLLRELYAGDVWAAQMKIFGDTRNNNGVAPYIAPGIYELVGFAKFDAQNGFPPFSGAKPWDLMRVVRKHGFPRDIRMIKTDETGAKSFRDPMDALAQLVQLNL